jgi:hypothetical protein
MRGEQRLCTCNKCALIPHMDRIDRAAVDGTSDPVQCIADEAVSRRYAGSSQLVG